MDLPVGGLTVNANGFANYQYPITVPPGAGHGNEPNLSLNFSHGIAVNDIVGSKWSLGGLSSIITIPPSAAVDNDPRKPGGSTSFRYSMDGSELLCTNGNYGLPGSTYMKEVENGNVTIVTYNQDDTFTVTNQFGCRWIYGSTEESRIRASFAGAPTMTVEWKLTRAYDSRNNYVQYVYEHPPPLPSSKILASNGDLGATYLSYIQYTCNDTLNYMGKMKVNFTYEQRPDIVIATVWGRLITTAHLLTKIFTTVDSADGTKSFLARSYTLAYTRSQATGDSLLTSIAETGSDGKFLTPTTFEYTGKAPADWSKSLFKYDSSNAMGLANTWNTQALIPLNMTGRAYSDLACIQFDPQKAMMNLHAFTGNPVLDQTGTNWTTNWDPLGNAPVMLGQVVSPQRTSLIIADVDGDGRTDIVMAYSDPIGRLIFSIAKSTGSGYASPVQVVTSQLWPMSSRFFAIDVTGDQTIDIVQIVSDGATFHINTFFDVNANLKSSHQWNPTISQPWQDNSRTVDWFPIHQHGRNATLLVQVTDTPAIGNPNMSTLTAKIFSAASDEPFSKNPFVKKEEITLSTYTPDVTQQISVLAVDINGDGVSDLVLCIASYSKSGNTWTLKLSFQSFLFDGQSNFIAQPVVSYDQVATSTGDLPMDGSFYVLNLDRSRYPCVTYIHKTDAHDYTAIYGMGNGAGQVTKPYTTLVIASSDTHVESWRIAPADLNGSGKAGLLLQSFDNINPCFMCPIYNANIVSDFLISTTNPVGLRQEISYASLSLPGLYDPGVSWQYYSPQDSDDDVYIMGTSSYLVHEIKTLNDPSINALTVAGAKQGAYGRVMRYSYGGAKLNRKGRGYLGFSSFTELDVNSGIKKVSTLSTSWPTTGKLLQQDVYGSSHADLLTRFDQWPPNAKPADIDKLQWLQSNISQYEAIALMNDGSGVRVANQNMAPVTVVRESTSATKFVQMSDIKGNIEYTFGTKCTYVSNSNQKLSEYSYSRDESTGEIVTELWKYTQLGPAINGIQILPRGRKQTASANPYPSYDAYEQLDLSLTNYTYDPRTGTLSTSSVWSSDRSQFEISQHQFDDFGNQIVETDPTGLTIVTTFDPIYHTFPIRKKYSGPTVNLTEYSAYDPRYGTRFMVQSAYGDIEIAVKDEYGRSSQLWRTPADIADGSPVRQAIKVPECLVRDQTLHDAWLDLPVCLNQEFTYDSMISHAGANFLTRSRVLYNDKDTRKTDAAVELIDCEGRVRKLKSQSDGLTPVSWQYREYSVSGTQILESYAAQLTAGVDGADWIPDHQACNLAILDALERPVLSLAPPSTPGNPFITLETNHTLGDTVKTTTTRQSNTFGYNGNNKTTEFMQYKFSRYDKQVRVLSQTTNSGLIQTYAYDALGRLTKTIDPGRMVDVRMYNSIGQLSAVNNIYNNPTTIDSANVPIDFMGERNTYDARGRILTQTNALGKKINFTYDAKGRILERRDPDYRVTTYTYDQDHATQAKLSNVKITFNAPGQTAQDELKYLYSYDPTGRISSETLEIPTGKAGGSFKTSYIYDRQGHLLQKTLPDLSTLSYIWKGHSLVNVTLKSPKGESWDVSTDYSNFNADGLAQSWSLAAHGQLTASISGFSSYDIQKRPIARSLQNPSNQPLVNYKLHFDSLGRIDSQTETVSGETATYTYVDQRLSTSTSSVRGAASYLYDGSGNMIQKANQRITYNRYPRASGYASISTQDATGSYTCSYDVAGRVVSRQIPGAQLVHLTYDGYGKMRSHSVDGGETTTLFSDHTGQTVVKTSTTNSAEIYRGKDFSILLAADGTKYIRRNIFDASLRHIIASVTSKYSSSSSTVMDVQLDAYMTDHKGTVTHAFDGNGSLRRKHVYDDYGLQISVVTNQSSGKVVTETAGLPSSMESNYRDALTGLVDFTGRWYDPYIGRFTTPDISLQPRFIQQLDGANLCAFECNDPINRVDPTGHFNWNLFGAIAIGIVLIAASFVVPGSGILVAAISGALMGAGIASLGYGVSNRNNRDAKSFWKGWGVDVAIGAATGFVTGGAGEWAAGSATLDSMMGVNSEAYAAARAAGTEAEKFSARWLVGVGGKTLISGLTAVGQQAADVEAENAVLGTHQNLSWQELMITGVQSALTAGFLNSTKGIANLAPETQEFKLGAKLALQSVKESVADNWYKPFVWFVEDDGYYFTRVLSIHTGMMFV